MVCRPAPTGVHFAGSQHKDSIELNEGYSCCQDTLDYLFPETSRQNKGLTILTGVIDPEQQQDLCYFQIVAAGKDEHKS